MNSIFESIERVRQMEEIFDALSDGINKEPPCIDAKLMRILVDYYESPDWMNDYELDEAGLLPCDLKRGVLSEDGVYNLLLYIESL